MIASRIRTALIAAAIVTLPAAAWADGHSEIVNAAAHAGLAAQASDVGGVHTHLHHALNCLVGPGGEGFDSTQMNPCAQAGSGAIADASNDTVKLTLKKAADKAREGIATADLTQAKADAATVKEILDAAK